MPGDLSVELRWAFPILLLAVLSMLTVDLPLAEFMKAHVTGSAAVAGRALSGLGVANPYILAGLIGMFVLPFLTEAGLVRLSRAGLERVQRLSLLLLASLAVSGATVHAIKFAVGRLRPRALFANAEAGFAPFTFLHGADSFPSGHSQTVFVVAMVLCIALPRRALAFCAVAGLVAATRVIMTNHYLADVLVGSYIGVATVLLLAPSILDRSDLTSRNARPQSRRSAAP
jgi:membrane-associated phospholipid phosphatase